jgi:LEA14-like dessication related protein
MIATGLAITAFALAACESLPETIVSSPAVELRDVTLVGLGFSNQTFLLSFDISNPNPFSLPVSHISYGVKLDGQRFASGQTPSDIAVPASGTSPRTEIPYELEGELGVDIPFAPPVSYRSNGAIQLGSQAN